ncbi:hypothetical protein Emed_006586 [Eimeria media]
MAHATAEASPQRSSELFSYFAVHTDTPCISGSVEAALRVFAKMILSGSAGAPFRLGTPKLDSEALGGNKWLLLLAMRSQNYEAQKVISEKILRQRQQLLQLPAEETALAPAAVAAKCDAPVAANLKQQQQQQQQQLLLSRRQQLMLEQEQLLLEEQRLQREQQQLKRQHTMCRPALYRRLRQMLPSSSSSISSSSSSSSSSKSTFLGEALRQQRLLFSSRPFASLQMGRWVGFRIGCLFCKLTTTTTAEREHTAATARETTRAVTVRLSPVPHIFVHSV